MNKTQEKVYELIKELKNSIEALECDKSDCKECAMFQFNDATDCFICVAGTLESEIPIKMVEE